MIRTKKIIFIIIMTACVLVPMVIPVHAYISDWKFGENTRIIERNIRSVGNNKSYFRITASNNGIWEPLSIASANYTDDPNTYSKNNKFTFEIYDADEWLVNFYGIIKIRHPGVEYWTVIAEQNYGPNPVRISETLTREFIVEHGFALQAPATSNTYIFEVYFKNTFTFFGTTTYTDQIKVFFYYEDASSPPPGGPPEPDPPGGDIN